MSHRSWWPNPGKRQRTSTARKRLELSFRSPQPPRASQFAKDSSRVQTNRISTDKRRSGFSSRVRGSSSTLRCYADRQPRPPRKRPLSTGEELELLLDEEETNTRTCKFGDDDDDDVYEVIDEIVDVGWSDSDGPTEQFFDFPNDPIDSPTALSALDLPWIQSPPRSTSVDLSPVLYAPQSRLPLILSQFLGLCDHLFEQLAACHDLDFWLIGMVFIYFRRLPEQQRSWNARAFYLLLYLAVQMEEEDAADLEYFVIDRALETFPEPSRTFHFFNQEKNRMWTALQYHTHIHFDELEASFMTFPAHRIFALQRESQ